MMAGLLALAQSMNRLAVIVPLVGNDVAKQVASTIMNDLVQVTPVDVGKALSNWAVTLNAPSFEPIPAYAPSPRGSMKRGQWTHAVDPSITAQANVPPTLEAAQAIIDAKLSGQPLFITNNVDYIVALDQGTSDQAPAGFVDRAVLLGEQAVLHATVKL